MQYFSHRESLGNEAQRDRLTYRYPETTTCPIPIRVDVACWS
jgi:hypothetical protein